MKKIIMFAIAMSLNGAVFASGFEGFRTLNLTGLDAQMISDSEVVIPAVKQKAAININKTKNSGYYFQNGVCVNAFGKRGYNKISVSVFLKNPWKGECADLHNARLRKAKLRGANLKGANLSGADLRDASLVNAHMSGAFFKNANLSNAGIYGAYLIKADLRGAILKNVNLCRADMSGANLSGAVLTGSFLIETYLTNATMNGADLRNVNLSKARMEGSKVIKANMQGAKYNYWTYLPFSEARAKARGMIKVD